jgi:diguanylate cyclase (GGDEF)-like protein/PAS domain S-box-containing protein
MTTESQPDFRSLIGKTSDVYFRYRLGYGMEWVNQGFQDLTGYASDHMVGRRGFLEEVIPPENLREIQASIERFRRGEAESSSVVTRLRRADGRWVWAEMFLVPARDEAGQLSGVEGVGRDVSQHLEVADLLSRRTREQSVLLRLQREILSHIDSELPLSLVVQEAQTTLKADECSLFVAREAEDELVRVAQAPTEYPGAGEAWLARWVAARGSAQRVEHTLDDVRADPIRPDRSVLAAPLGLGERTAGALVARASPGAFVESDLDFLITLAQLASLAIANLSSYHEVKRQATLDGLTGAYNRRFFDAGLTDELHRSQRLASSVGLLMVDVDELKRVNDTYGHVAGDDLLRVVVHAQQKKLRDTDWVARYGGDEFAVVLPGCHPDQLLAVAEGLHRVTTEASVPLPGGGCLHPSLSIGGAAYPQSAEDVSGLVAAADLAEREAKRAGGGRVVVRLERG